LSLRPVEKQRGNSDAPQRRRQAAWLPRFSSHLDRAGGVPLFVEEIIRMLQESGQLVEKNGFLDAAAGIQDLKIPETLQHSLMAAGSTGSAGQSCSSSSAV